MTSKPLAVCDPRDVTVTNLIAGNRKIRWHGGSAESRECGVKEARMNTQQEVVGAQTEEAALIANSAAMSARLKAIRDGGYCEHGDHSYCETPVPAVGYVHSGNNSDSYHLGVCSEHIVPFRESNLLCDCAIPGKWPLQVAEKQYHLLELRNANRSLLFTVAGILLAPTANSSNESVPNALDKAKEIIAEVEDYPIVQPGDSVRINLVRSLTAIPDVAKLAATIFATKTPTSSDQQDVQNAVRWASQLWLASQSHV